MGAMMKSPEEIAAEVIGDNVIGALALRAVIAEGIRRDREQKPDIINAAPLEEEVSRQARRADLAEQRIATAIDYLSKRSWGNGVAPRAMEMLGYKFEREQ